MFRCFQSSQVSKGSERAVNCDNSGSLITAGSLLHAEGRHVVLKAAVWGRHLHDETPVRVREHRWEPNGDACTYMSVVCMKHRRLCFLNSTYRFIRIIIFLTSISCLYFWCLDFTSNDLRASTCLKTAKVYDPDFLEKFPSGLGKFSQTNIFLLWRQNELPSVCCFSSEPKNKNDKKQKQGKAEDLTAEIMNS